MNLGEVLTPSMRTRYHLSDILPRGCAEVAPAGESRKRKGLMVV